MHSVEKFIHRISKVCWIEQNWLSVGNTEKTPLAQIEGITSSNEKQKYCEIKLSKVKNESLKVVEEIHGYA